MSHLETRSISSEDDVVLEVRDAAVTFGMTRGTSRVLNQVDLDIRRGEILGVVGESGSGKSMLANAILDAVPNPGQTNGEIKYYPTEGEDPIDILRLEGEELRQLRWEKISMLFQGAMSSFNPVMRIADHFIETLHDHGYDPQEGMRRARELITELHMDPDRVLKSFPHELSGGMKQRTLIALSLILEPEVLIMDEPTAALDLLMQRSILNLLGNLKDQYDLTLVFITHDLPLVADLADRIAVMYAFEIVEIGSKKRILEEPAHPYTRLLLRATPALDVPLEHMQSIEGSSPDPVNVPTGCSFHPRCPLATDECSEADPPFKTISEGHGVACFHWEQSEERISLTYDDDVITTGKKRPPSTSTNSEDSLLSIDELTIEFEERKGILSRVFNEPTTLVAVDEVNIDIYERDVVALVGESGCGKTTLGKAAIGLQRPTSGSVIFRGQCIWEANDEQKSFFSFGESNVEIPFEDIRRSLQIIHQDPGSAINPNKTVMSSLTKPLKRWHPMMDHNEREMRIYALLEAVGMTPPQAYAKRYPHQLSGGEQQRVVLIRALLMNPDLILADEAISALDVSLRVEMMDLFHDLQNTFNTSYLFISHDLSNARYLAEKADGRIAVMYLGNIVEIGPVEAVINNPEHPYTKVLRWATPNLATIDTDREAMPIRNIDIPDAVDRPSGCRFHTRCPDARKICASLEPEHVETEDGKHVACFRADDDHEYWDSLPLNEEDLIKGESKTEGSGSVLESSSDD